MRGCPIGPGPRGQVLPRERQSAGRKRLPSVSWRTSSYAPPSPLKSPARIDTSPAAGVASLSSQALIHDAPHRRTRWRQSRSR
jgi:hypothetical protein